MKKIYGLDNEYVEANFFDVDFREAYQNGFEEFQAKVQSVPETASEIDTLKAIAEAIKKFLNACFGDGTTDRLFKGKRDLTAYFNFLNSLVKAQYEADEDFQKLSTQVMGDMNKLAEKVNK